MTNFSATQAISPAIERTRQFLYRPFILGRFLKLTLVALLTEGGISTCNYNSQIPSGKTGGPSSIPFHWPAINFPAFSVILVVTAIVMAIAIPIVLVIGYLLIRLRFSYFDCLLNEQDQIAPAWSRYHRQAMRYLGLSLFIGVAFWIVLIPVGYAIYEHFKLLFQSIGSAHPPGFPEFLPLIAIVGPLVLLLALVGYLVDTAMTCFVLPRMGLEDATIRDALEDVWSDLQAEPGQFALFIFLRFLLSIVASVLTAIVLAIPLIPIVILGVIIAMILKAVSVTLAIALGVPAAILAGVFFLLAVIGVIGTIGTFRRNYALLFYAGRYPELAMALWPPLPPAPFPSQEPGFPSGPQRAV
jgi:hypothetical protein